MLAPVLVDHSQFVEEIFPPSFSNPCISKSVVLRLGSTSEYPKEPVDNTDACYPPQTSNSALPKMDPGFCIVNMCPR